MSMLRQFVDESKPAQLQIQDRSDQIHCCRCCYSWLWFGLCTATSTAGTLAMGKMAARQKTWLFLSLVIVADRSVPNSERLGISDKAASMDRQGRKNKTRLIHVE